MPVRASGGLRFWRQIDQADHTALWGLKGERGATTASGKTLAPFTAFVSDGHAASAHLGQPEQQLIRRHVLATRRFTESHGVVEASGDA
jgi:hypothetical protein